MANIEIQDKIDLIRMVPPVKHLTNYQLTPATPTSLGFFPSIEKVETLTMPDVA